MRRLHQVLLREAPRHSASRVRVRAAPPLALAWAREVIPVAARRRRYGTAFRSVVPTFGDADIHRRIMLSIGQATTPNELLELFETESAALDEHEYGWYTAKATVDRIFRMVKKQRQSVDTSDARFTAILQLLQLALEQNVMSAKARMGHHTDDLTSLESALKDLKQTDTELYRVLTAKLEESESSEGEEFLY